MSWATSLNDCVHRFVDATGIPMTDWNDESKWRPEQKSPQLWHVCEVEPVRALRRAHLEHVSPLWIGWWEHCADQKVEHRDCDEATRLLADQIQVPRADFLRDIANPALWKVEMNGNGRFRIIEMSAAPVCPECQGKRYVILFTSKDPCSLCGPKAVSP
jgi:hypothetical protein